MRLILPSVLTLILLASAAQAQSIIDDLPGMAPPTSPIVEPAAAPPAAKQQPIPAAPVPAAAMPAATAASAVTPQISDDGYTVSDVAADVTADTAAHARDQALLQAEHTAFDQICSHMNAPDSAGKIGDDALAALVQSFDVQSERLSAVRYIGVFTIHFKPISVQKKLGKYMTGAVDSGGNPMLPEDTKAALQADMSHMVVGVQTPSLAAWTQTKRRLTLIDQVARVDLLDLGRGESHVDLYYSGTLDNFQKELGTQGFLLRQSAAGEWELIDGAGSSPR